MKKPKNTKYNRKREIRYHNIEIAKSNGKIVNIPHPAYVFLEKGNAYIYVTITHSKNIKDMVVIELKRNPNPKDNRKAYWVAEVKEDYKEAFGKRKPWSLEIEDDRKIRKMVKNKR